VTTIAARVTDSALELAWDTQLSGGGVMNRVCKGYALQGGGLIAGAGAWHQAYLAIQWVVAGERGECPNFEDANLLLIRPDGVIWMADGLWPPYPLLNEYSALGSGAQGAMAAMAGGKTARQAVEDVTGVDRNSSPPVEVLRVRRRK
jgi:hypothetical protein